MLKYRLSDLFHYFLLNGANLFVPILIFSINFRTLSYSNIATLSISITLNAFVYVLIEFGFNNIGVARVVNCRLKGIDLSIVFSQVIITRLTIFIVALGVFVLLFLIAPDFKEFYLLNTLALLGLTINPFWFFQALEDMKIYTYVTVFFKTLSLYLVWVFVNGDDDFLLLSAIVGGTSIASSIIALFYAMLKYRVGVRLSGEILRMSNYVENYELLKARILVSIYSSSNVFIVNYFLGSQATAAYSVIEKFIILVGAVFEPINQLIFPQLVKHNNRLGREWNIAITRYLAFSLLIILFIVVIIYQFGDYILFTYLGLDNQEVQELLRLSCFVFLTIPFGPVFSNLLLAKREISAYFKVLITTVGLNFILVPAFTITFQLVGFIESYAVVLFIHVILLFVFFKRAYYGFKFQVI